MLFHRAGAAVHVGAPANLHHATLRRVGADQCTTPIPPPTLPGLTFEFLANTVPGTPPSPPAPFPVTYIFACLQYDLVGGIDTHATPWLLSNEGGFTDGFFIPPQFGVSYAGNGTGGSVGVAERHGSAFTQPAVAPGITDGAGTLHHWALRLRFTPTHGSNPHTVGNMTAECFKDGVLQPGALATAFPPAVAAVPAMRLASENADRTGTLVPTFTGLMATARLTRGALSDAQIAADAAACLAGTVHPLRADTVGLWQLQNSQADAGPNAFNLSVETGAAAYAALGNGLVGLNFDGATDLISPHSNLLICFP